MFPCGCRDLIADNYISWRSKVGNFSAASGMIECRLGLGEDVTFFAAEKLLRMGEGVRRKREFVSDVVP